MTFQNTGADFAPIELKDDGDADATAIVTKALEDLQGSVDERLKAIEAKSAKLEARLNRPGVGAPVDEKTAGEIELKAFATYLRAGKDALGADEVKALTVAGPSTGGVLAPPSYEATIIQKIAEFSPVRALAGRVTMNGPLLQLPRLVDEVVPGEVTETGPRPEDEPSFEQIDVKPHEMAVIVPVSQTILEDSAIDLNAFLAAHLGTKFGQREAMWFVKGNGTTQAEGVLTSSEVGAVEVDDIEHDALVDLFYSIKSAYSARGSFLMNRKTMAVVRKLKDTTGAPLWQPALTAGQPASLLGAPVYEAVDMPDPVAGATPIVFGDFAAGYLIADRVNLQFNTDNMTGFGNGLVKIGARRRVGGRVVLGEALAKLKLAA
ncbi:MAG TPA: phage major capsid protein [Beijerinckiaceae bacterium]|jgi:HK97 family phage major capsid protein